MRLRSVPGIPGLLLLDQIGYDPTAASELRQLREQLPAGDATAAIGVAGSVDLAGEPGPLEALGARGPIDQPVPGDEHRRVIPLDGGRNAILLNADAAPLIQAVLEAARRHVASGTNMRSALLADAVSALDTRFPHLNLGPPTLGGTQNSGGTPAGGK